MRLFTITRWTGPGILADRPEREGVVFDDGTVALRLLGGPEGEFFGRLEDVIERFNLRGSDTLLITFLDGHPDHLPPE